MLRDCGIWFPGLRTGHAAPQLDLLSLVEFLAPPLFLFLGNPFWDVDCAVDYLKGKAL